MVLSAVGTKTADECEQYRHAAEANFENLESKLFPNFIFVAAQTSPITHYTKDLVSHAAC